MTDKAKAETQETSEPLSWNVKFFGPEGYDEHIRVTAKDGQELAKVREATIAILKDIGATGSRVSKAPTGSSDAAAVAVASAATAAGGVSKTCPKHNVAMDTVPKVSKFNPVVVPGVTSHNSKSGKQYKAFWSCPVDECSER